MNLLELQKSFEQGTIKEEDLSEEEKNSLIELYEKQIEDLQKAIDDNKRAFEMYREKIVNIRNKIQSINLTWINTRF